MSKNIFFPYNWFIDEADTEITSIRIYGIGENNENICVRITDFTPYVYLELPTTIPWDDAKAQLLANKIAEEMKINQPLMKQLKYKHKLYGAHLKENGGSRKLFPYLFCSFSSKNDIKILMYKIQKRNFVIQGLGVVKLKMHEQDADPILQLTIVKDLPTAGWIKFYGDLISSEDDKITLCDLEYKVKYKNLSRHNEKVVLGLPKILGFDIEVNSSNPSAMPKVDKPDDKIFQISCVFSRECSNDHLSYLLTLGDPIQEMVGMDVIIQRYINEAELLVGFTELIRTENPNVISGYNILNFDIPYMIERAKRPGRVIHIFDTLGFHKYAHAKEKTIKWSSSAYKNQEFSFLDAEGRLFVDLLPLVKRDYKMDNYKLKTVSDYFLGQTKDDLSVKGIFKCYRIGTKKEVDGTYSNKARKAMSIVGKYCIQDSVLVVKLMSKLDIWTGLSEMAKTCGTSMFSIFSQGQQIKVYSQVYKFCFINNIVVEKDGYICKDDERYTGAHVFPPVPGIYDRVVPFDFASLYPTTIIAYNIDYSTLVTDDKIPDSKCHIMSWSDHISCTHDPKVIRKNELTIFIDTEKDKIKKLREKRDNKKNKSTKQNIIDELNKKVEELKPYIAERSKIMKTITTKNVMCAERYYRFLKEPKGVMPTILQNLLDARKNTRNIIKENNKQIKNITDETKINDLKLFNNVLDKRQLAYKISSNSMYGSMGVKRGYLPFMPGAMCLLGDSLISHSFGFTRKMKDLVKTDNLWSYKNGQVVSNGKGLIYKGKRDLVRITLIDGRILKCTPDHKIMTTTGWIEAGKLLPKHNWDGEVFKTNIEFSKVIVGLELPEDVIGKDEKKWKLLDYSMETPNNREKTLAFCRVLGFVLSDGSITDKELLSCKVCIGTLLDSKNFVNDIKILTGQEPMISYSERLEIKGNVFHIHVPKILAAKIILIDGVGKRTHQPFTLPKFIFEPDCPLSVVREFLGGLFGGDGTSPSLSVSHPSFSPVEFGISTIEKYKDDMFDIMNKLIILLERLDMKFWLRKPRLSRESIKENPRWEYLITTNNCFSLLFAQKIGFRYCSDKSNKLTVAASYQRYSDNVKKQHIDIVLKASEMFDLHDKHYKTKYILEKARKEIYENEIPLHEYYSLSKSTDVYNYRAKPYVLEGLLQKYFPTAREYAQMTGCDHWFSEEKKYKKIYSLERYQKSNPCLYLDVVDVRYDGVDDVYDIIDVPNQSFIANGIVVHNCTTFMGRTNIEIVAKTITEKYKGELVYGDTDSNYIHFPYLKTPKETWDYAEMVADEVSKLFPPPIKLEFEQTLYWLFFIITKKRYMYKSCDEYGNIDNKVGKKGVLLARRDGSVFIRTLYEQIIMKIFEKEDRDNILYYILQQFNKLCSNSFSYKEFVVTKAVGDTHNMKHAPHLDETGKIIPNKIKIGDYIVPKLPTDKKQREEQLKKKKVDTEKEYYEKCLPAQVQLAEKMRNRGQPVQVGSRLEFLISDIENHLGKQYDKLESIDYFMNHSDILKVDFFYYIKIAVNSIDEILNIAFDTNNQYQYKFKKDFIQEQYNFRYKIRRKMLEKIKNFSKTKIIFM